MDNSKEEGLRKEILSSTRQLQQYLLDAVDEIEIKRTQVEPGKTPPIARDRSMQAFVSTEKYAPNPNPLVPMPSPSMIPIGQTSRSVKKPFFWNPKSVVGIKRDQRKGGTVKSKKKKIPSWTHTFICLARCDQQQVPDSEERMQLQLEDLGEKKITIANDAVGWEIYEEIQYQFPKLKKAGGFEMLRVDSGKALQIIACPKNGYTIPYLRAVVHNAKIYIRPLQRDLHCHSDANEDDEDTQVPACPPPREPCMSCGTLLNVCDIREHIVTCMDKAKRSIATVVDDDDPSNLFVNAVDGTSSHDSISNHESSIDGSSSNIAHVESLNTAIDESPVYVSDDSETELPSMQLALKISMESLSPQQSTEFSSEPRSICDVVLKLKKHLRLNECFDMVIRRSHVLSDALRRVKKETFHPEKLINVEFVGESGADIGGLTREFFRLLSQHFATIYLDSTGCFKHNSVALQDGVYYYLGQLSAMNLVHGGSAMRLFSPSVYSFLCGSKACDIIAQPEEVADISIKELMKKIVGANNIEELRSILMDNCAVIVESGYNKPLAYAQMEDRTTIVQTLSLHQVILKSLGEVQQFRDGLKSLKVANMLIEHGDLLKSFFCNDKMLKEPLTADDFRKLFRKIVYSEVGSNERIKEEQTFIYFLDYLEKCEKVSTKESENHIHCTENCDEEDYGVDIEVMQDKVSLEMILAFFTGANELPPLGLPHDPQLNFSPTALYPTASTCAIELTLPTRYENSDDFDIALNTAFICHGGIGLT